MSTATLQPSSTASRSKPAPSASVAGMGAIPLSGSSGVAFRVWAPHADAVSVVGSFNDWDAAAHPLAKEGSGNWYAAIPSAKPGDEYRFALKRGDDEFTRIDPRALRVTNSIGNGVIWQKPASPTSAGAKKFTPPTLDQLVIYELHIGTFNTSKETGPGTFASATEKLPYLRDLGINAVEVMPVAEFAGDFSWGYNPAHPYAVESIYGGPDAFLAFIEAAHAHGIAVILDVVYNHFGPGDLSIWQFDGWNENNLGGIYFYNDWRAQTPWGDTRPDYGRGEVRSYIRDNALMWFRDFGIDGLRWDMSVYIRTYKGNTGDPADDLKEGWGLCQWVNDEIHKEFPHAITIAEDLHDSEWIVKGTGAGGAGFNSQWDAAFVHPVRATMIVANDEHRSLDAVIGALKNKYDDDAFKRVVYSESHDEVANGKARLPSEIDANAADAYHARKRSTLGAALVMTAPGIPMLFQGQELLEDEWFRDEVPLDWEKQSRFAGVHALYRDLVSLRRNLSGHTAGLSGQHIETHHVNHEKKILGFHRWRDHGAGDDVIVIMNLSSEPVTDYAIGVPSTGNWRVRFNSDAKAYSPDFNDHTAPDAETVAEPLDGFEHRIVTGLAPYSALILSQDRAS
ncbi:1,4-alpha-glucan branching protein [Nibricoccus aquaticus]|uniref:1,4-alpha-glucan branching enzyme n=1 Tax=Nibricoccus aquaticus TaxID=2576891 RepID=A0A290QMU9_9BACT|nr:alpha-amylase family glycosyl hydrolase [Nibricoccus aquaticus]ATC65532.1 1,4-alpha-glucan branching protein [Nibricoccus aquaticus]